MDVSLPHTKYALATYYLLAPAEASSNLARYDGVRYGLRAKDARGLKEMYGQTRERGFGAEVKRRIMLGTYALSAGYYDAYYLRAQKVRTLIREDFSRAFEQVDAILSPISPVPAFKLGEKVDDPLAMYLMDVFTLPCNLAGLPGLSLPCGFTKSNLPIGLQMLGKPFDEARCCASRGPTSGSTTSTAASRRCRGAPHGNAMSLSDFQPVIGLEVHAQLLTKSKIFCGCSTEFGAEPNRNTCPVCLGMPGVLPVLNQRVMEFAVRTGLALGCTIKKTSIWSRKNYFYPDLPKGYQITQYDQPICEWGKLTIDMPEGEKTIRVRRIHMEEDAGKNVHDAAVGESLVDLNRAGVPLLEIVSEPDLRSADEAVEYLKALARRAGVPRE